MKGYITLEKCIVNKSLVELERILGYERGRLSDGAEVYGFTRLPEVYEFELRGYTHLPGGGKPLIDNAKGTLDFEKIKQIVRKEVWSLTGRNRLVKVVPLKRGTEYPIALGVPQWELVKDVPARLINRLKPRDVYRA